MKRFVALICVLMLPLDVYAQADKMDLLNQEAELEALDFSQAIRDISTNGAAVLKTTANPAQVENEFYYVIILALLCLVSLSIVLSRP